MPRTHLHPEPPEPHGDDVAGKLNWLRAGVLGANDGIVSTSGLIVGVAAADPTATGTILVAGVAGLVSGAVSMALGEYVSVSTQRDTERALITQEAGELRDYPEQELEELTGLYQKQGLSRGVAEKVAAELTAHDALGAHLQIELGIRRGNLTSPWQAAAASAVSFTVGAIIPLVAALLTPPGWRIGVTVVAVLIALALTGWVSARLGSARVRPALVRLLIGGALGMAVTFGIGRLVGLVGACGAGSAVSGPDVPNGPQVQRVQGLGHCHRLLEVRQVSGVGDLHVLRPGQRLRHLPGRLGGAEGVVGAAGHQGRDIEVLQRLDPGRAGGHGPLGPGDPGCGCGGQPGAYVGDHLGAIGQGRRTERGVGHSGDDRGARPGLGPGGGIEAVRPAGLVVCGGLGVQQPDPRQHPGAVVGDRHGRVSAHRQSGDHRPVDPEIGQVGQDGLGVRLQGGFAGRDR